MLKFIHSFVHLSINLHSVQSSLLGNLKIFKNVEILKMLLPNFCLQRLKKRKYTFLFEINKTPKVKADSPFTFIFNFPVLGQVGSNFRENH